MAYARKLLLVAVLAGILSGVAAGASSAADICWVGPSTGASWSTPANWRGGVVPGSGDNAELDVLPGSGCVIPNDVTVTANASIGAIEQYNNVVKVASPATLTIAGTSPDDFGMGALDVADGAAVHIANGARVNVAGTWTLHNTGLVTVDGELKSAYTSLVVQGGTLRVPADGKMTAPSLQVLLQDTKFDMQGTVDLTGGYLGGGEMYIGATATSPVSTGTWIGNGSSWFRGDVRGGVTYTITGPVSGRWSAQAGQGGNGPAVIKLAGSAACSLADLDIYETAGFEIDRDCTVAGKLTLKGSSYRYSGRNGTGTLTAASAEIDGGGFFDAGLTKITGATNIIGNSLAPAIYNGATLRTEGATTWQQGYVSLGASNQTGPGTWENAGALTINDGGGAPGLIDVSPTFASGGALKNLATGTITRTAPTGSFPVTARIENAGRIDVQAGTMGGSLGGPYPYGSLVQSGGVTGVAAGATLDMDTTLNGGTLKGNGTVRSVANPGGTVAPGESPGALTITGAFTQGAGGTLLEDIAGTALASFDRLLVGGAATLGGTVKIVKDPAYSPTPGDSYNILTSASRAGTFTAVTGDGGFLDSYRPDGATLTYASSAGRPSGGSDPAPGGGGTPTTSGGGTTTTPVAGSGATTGPPATTTQQRPIVPTAVAIESIATLPAAKQCVSRRDFRIRLRIPKGKKVTSAEVRVAGRKVAVLKGKRLTARVRLTGLPKGTFTFTITLTLAGNGGKLTGSRTYHTCAARKRA